MLASLISIWIISAFINYGLWVAYFQLEWPELAYEDRVNDRVIGAIISLIGGPISLIIVPFTTGFSRGWML